MGLIIQPAAAGMQSTGGTFTGAVLFPDGTVGAPAIGWALDADGTGTGFYAPARDQVGVTINGTQRAVFAANPALSLTGELDLTTNVYAQVAGAARVVIGDRGPGGESGIAFGSASDIVLYRAAAARARLNGQLDADTDVRSRVGVAAGQAMIGAVGPGSEGGITAGSAVDTTIYRSAAGVWTIAHGGTPLLVPNGSISAASAVAGAAVLGAAGAANQPGIAMNADTSLARVSTGRVHLSKINASGFDLATGAAAGGTDVGGCLSYGTGAPNNASGVNGDLYLRVDGAALSTIYQRRAGAWVGVV